MSFLMTILIQYFFSETAQGQIGRRFGPDFS